MLIIDKLFDLLMIVLRLQIPRVFVHKMGLSDIFEDVNNIEILTAYQYDRKNFFSLQRITFKRGILPADYDEMISFVKNKFNIINMELIERSKDSIFGTMKQRRNQGFWTMFEMGSWALIFPIIVNQDYLIVTVLGNDKTLSTLKQMLDKLLDDSEPYKILAQSDKGSIEKFGFLNLPFPNFSRRQREISQYAAMNGYFQSPKRISAKQIAQYFGISESAVNENLRKAQQIAMTYFFGTGDSKSNNYKINLDESIKEINRSTNKKFIAA